MGIGTISIGIKCPIIRENDDIKRVVIDALKDIELCDNDIIGITESVVARSLGLYVTVDNIVTFLEKNNYSKQIALYKPIMSRNRFSLILKAFARYCDNIVIILGDTTDEVGNPIHGINPWTGVNIQDYYSDICESENCNLMFKSETIFRNGFEPEEYGYQVVDARCHPTYTGLKTLKDICVDRCPYGLMGSNMSDNETLKLFPTGTMDMCYVLQKMIQEERGVHVEVMVYGDGCYKDPTSEIWEFADPTTSPGYTDGLSGSPREIKIKYLADSKYKQLDGDKLTDAIKKEVSNRNSNTDIIAGQGTTPRRYVDLLASLMDLTSGSGSKGTPIVLVKNYFKDFSND